MALRTVGVRLTADVSGYVSGLRRATESTRTFGQTLNRQASAGQLDAIADRAGVMGLALGGAAAYAVKQFMNFDKQMSAVRAATNASAKDMEALRKAAIKAGADTKYSATEAAKGVEELAKAGVSTKDILSGGLSGALSLAAAGEIEVGEAAELAASAMTQFKLKGADLPHVADLLAAGAGKAQGTVQQLGWALKQSGLVAAQTGLTIEETTGTLAAFASAGLLSSDAGTSLKQMFLMLQAPSNKSKAMMDQLGISLYDASGQFMGMTKFAEQLRVALGNMTPEVRMNAMAQIFGADAVRGAAIIYENGAKGIQQWIDKTNDSGYAADVARIKTDNLVGDLERLRGSVETLAIQSGTGANGGLRQLTQILDELVDGFADLPPVLGQAITVLAAVGAAAVLGSAGWVKMRRSVAETLVEMRSTGPAGERAAKGLQAVTTWAGRATGAFIGLQAAQAVVASFQKDLNPQIEALGSGLNKWASGGALAGEASRVLGKDMDDLKDKFKFLADEDNSRRMAVKHIQSAFEALIPGLKGTNESLDKTKERIASVDQALSQMVAAGDGESARKIFADLTRELAIQGVTVAEVKKQFPQYAAALEGAVPAGEKAKEITKQLTGELEMTEDAAKKAKEAFDNLFGRLLDVDVAEINYYKALAETNKGLKDGKRSLDVHTAAGRENRDAALDMIKTIKDLREANAGNGMTIVEVDNRYRRQIETLRKNMINLGFNKEAVNKLLLKYKEVPAQLATAIEQPGMTKAQTQTKFYDSQIDNLARIVKTTFSQPGLPGARIQGEKYDDLLDDISRQIKTELKVVGDGPVSARLTHLLAQQRALQNGVSVAAGAALNQKDADRDRQRKYAVGGRVTGPGTGTSDSIPARLSNDEFVIKASSARQIGYGRLDEMNNTGSVGFAGGGRVVVAPFPVDVSKTKILSLAQALARVTPSASSSVSGATGPWMERMIEARFPGLEMISGFRRGARTLSGNRSYHSLNRAVDFPPSEALARFMYQNYKSRLKEAITPYQRYNVHNGRDHHYTGAIWRQHAFGYGNAHDHFAMANGGIIGEPVVGVGASGRTYSFGEYGPETVTPGVGKWMGGGGGGSVVTNVFHINVDVPPMANTAEVGRQVVGAIQDYERRSGSAWRRG